MKACLVTPLERRGPWRTPEVGTGAIPLALGGDCFPYSAQDLSPLETYDVLILHTASRLYEDVSRILDRFPHKITVLKLTCDAMFLDSQGFFPNWDRPLKNLLDRARLALIETADTSFFQAMTNTPVATWPHPVPVGALRRHALSRGRRASPAVVLLGSGFHARKNGLATALAFRQIRNTVAPEARGIVFCSDPQAEAKCYAKWGVQGVDALKGRCQAELWPVAAQCQLALHLDFRRSIGRFSVDCAGLGIPCISTGGIFMQRALFPDLIIDPWDVDGAVRLAELLMRDPTFYDVVTKRAANALEDFDLEPMAAQFWRLIQTVAG